MRYPTSRVRRGVSTVELAVLLPFLVFLAVAALDFGRILRCSQILTDTARDGAINAMYDSQNTNFYVVPGVKSAQTPEEAALAEATNLSPPPTISEAVEGTDEDGKPYVEVTATWEFNTITHYPGVPRSTTLSRTVRMRKFDPNKNK